MEGINENVTTLVLGKHANKTHPEGLPGRWAWRARFVPGHVDSEGGLNYAMWRDAIPEQHFAHDPARRDDPAQLVESGDIYA